MPDYEAPEPQFIRHSWDELTPLVEARCRTAARQRQADVAIVEAALRDRPWAYSAFERLLKPAVSSRRIPTGGAS